MSMDWKPLGVRPQGVEWPLGDSKNGRIFPLGRRIGEVHFHAPLIPSQFMALTFMRSMFTAELPASPQGTRLRGHKISTFQIISKPCASLFVSH